MERVIPALPIREGLDGFQQYGSSAVPTSHSCAHVVVDVVDAVDAVDAVGDLGGTVALIDRRPRSTSEVLGVGSDRYSEFVEGGGDA